MLVAFDELNGKMAASSSMALQGLSDAKTLEESPMQQSQSTPNHPVCGFNAVEQLRRRRLIAQDMTITLERAGELIHDIDEARWHHQEMTGCKFWQEAIERLADKNRMAQ